MMKESEITIILKWLNTIKVDMADDPILVGGFKYINHKLAEIHGFFEPLNRYMIEVAIAIRDVGKQLNIAQRTFEFEMAEKLANDTDVRDQKSYADREALAKSMLKNNLDEIQDLEQQLHNLKQFERILKLKSSNLQRINRDIRLQERALSTDLRLSMQTPGIPDDSESDYESSFDKIKKRKLEEEEFPDDFFESVEKDPVEKIETEKDTTHEEKDPVKGKSKKESSKMTLSEEEDLDGEIDSVLKEDDLSSVLVEKTPEDEPDKYFEKEKLDDDEEIDISALFADL